MISLPTWDLVISLFFLLAVGYGIILGINKVMAILIATYIGFVVSNEFGNAVYSFFSGQSSFGGNYWIKTNLSVFLIKTALLLILIILLGVRGGYSINVGGKGIKMGIMTAILSFLNAGLIVSSLIWFLTNEARMALLNQSHLASYITNLRNWWLILPVILMIVLGFLGGGQEE